MYTSDCIITHMSTSSQKRVLRMARQKRLFRLSEATAAGIHPEYIRRMMRQGQLHRVGRGLYAFSQLEPTEHHTLAEVAKRVPKGIFCLLTALRFHGFGTQNPREVWVAVDRRAGTPRIDFAPIRVVRTSNLASNEGVETHDFEHVRVRITSPARTVAECFKFRNKIGIDVAVEALRDFRRQRKSSPDELWHHAKRLRVAQVMRPYWDSLS